MYAAFLIVAALIIVIVVLNSKNKKLNLRVDAAEYQSAVAGGKLVKLSLEFADKDLECETAKAELETCKRKRDNKGRYIPRKRK